jgi:hypothetical protein
MVLVVGVFFMLLVVGCVLCTSDGWLILVVSHCLSVGYFRLFFLIREVQSQIFYILTSQEGIVDLQKIIFGAQYVLYLQTVYFISQQYIVLQSNFVDLTKIYV